MNDFVIDKPGRYRLRNGNKALVFFYDGLGGDPEIVGMRQFGSRGTDYRADTWKEDGMYRMHARWDDYDIVEYLGPLQPGDDGFGGKDE